MSFLLGYVIVMNW